MGDISYGRGVESAFENLLGEKNVTIQEFEEINDDYIGELSSNDKISVLCTSEALIAIDDNGKVVTAAQYHVLNPIGKEDNYVVFYDPWNSGKRLRISIDVLKNSGCNAYTCQLNNT